MKGDKEPEEKEMDSAEENGEDGQDTSFGSEDDERRNETE
jgi:hypothetical protein